MRILSEERMAQRKHKLAGPIDLVSDTPSRIQLAGPADPHMIQPLLLREVVWVCRDRPLDAVVRMKSDGGTLNNQPAREQVPDLKFAVANLGRNVRELLPDAEGIAPLEKRSGQDRI